MNLPNSYIEQRDTLPALTLPRIRQRCQLWFWLCPEIDDGMDNHDSGLPDNLYMLVWGWLQCFVCLDAGSHVIWAGLNI